MPQTEPPVFHLDSFLPYRINRLAERLSRSLAGVYGERFGVSVAQWRIIATLAETPGLRATQVAERCALDKVKVSRAVSDLSQRCLLQKNSVAADGRASELTLSPAGEQLFRDIAPLALAWERRLLEDLSDPDRCELRGLLDRLERAVPAGWPPPDQSGFAVP